jgi:NAD(P)H-hydrate repair Nnr-like enzyme with NAD(P)H-hydrate dehydratase domain
MGMERKDVEAEPANAACQAASELYSVMALKGALTFVATPRREVSVCREGNVGLATSGSGDVLAGIIAGLLARGAPAFVATCWGVYLHATAGDRLSRRIGPLGFLAHELLAEIPGIMGALSRDTPL